MRNVVGIDVNDRNRRTNRVSINDYSVPLSSQAWSNQDSATKNKQQMQPSQKSRANGRATEASFTHITSNSINYLHLPLSSVRCLHLMSWPSALEIQTPQPRGGRGKSETSLLHNVRLSAASSNPSQCLCQQPSRMKVSDFQTSPFTGLHGIPSRHLKRQCVSRMVKTLPVDRRTPFKTIQGSSPGHAKFRGARSRISRRCVTCRQCVG